MKVGQAAYEKSCADCHVADGTGIPGLYPPLAGNPNMNAKDPVSVIHILLAGSTKPLMGEGMPNYANLSDADLAAMSTYIRNSWGNNAPAVSESEVKKLRRIVVKRDPKLGETPAAPPPASEPAPEAAPAAEAAPAEAK
jgi:mono/diheme cytochrome c family protein